MDYNRLFCHFIDADHIMTIEMIIDYEPWALGAGVELKNKIVWLKVFSVVYSQLIFEMIEC